MTCSEPFCREPFLSGRDPTPEERRYLRRLQRVFDDIPPGCGLLTWGMGTVVLYRKADAEAAGITHLWDGGFERHGLEIGSVQALVQAVSG